MKKKKKERKKKYTEAFRGIYVLRIREKKIKLNLFHVVFLVLESKGLFCSQRNGWEEPVPSFRVVKTTQKQAKRKYVSRYLWKTGGGQFSHPFFVSWNLEQARAEEKSKYYT